MMIKGMGRHAAIALGGLGLATVSSVGLAGPASATMRAATCYETPNYAWGAITDGHPRVNGVNVRTAPSTSCGAIVEVANSSRHMDYWCYVVRGAYTWTYVHTYSHSGWVRDDLLSGWGSPYRCPSTSGWWR